jgi:hypothetical protein
MCNMCIHRGFVIEILNLRCVCGYIHMYICIYIVIHMGEGYRDLRPEVVINMYIYVYVYCHSQGVCYKDLKHEVCICMNKCVCGNVFTCIYVNASMS